MIPPFEVRVYYEDTDAGGIVYYANYLKFAERARTEALRALGFDQSRLLADPGIAIVVRSVAVNFHKPARLDDRLTITTELADIGQVSLRMRQAIRRDGEMLVTLDVKLAVVDGNLRPVRPPEALRCALLSLRAPSPTA